MTAEAIRRWSSFSSCFVCDVCRSCKDSHGISTGGYQTPHLNEVLYLHHQRFARIENLAEYVNLRTLWLEGNGVSEIQVVLPLVFSKQKIVEKGLETLVQLKCLFLQNNCIERLEGLSTLVNLHSINLQTFPFKTIFRSIECQPQLHQEDRKSLKL